jgi:hypothetical protein
MIVKFSTINVEMTSGHDLMTLESVWRQLFPKRIKCVSDLLAMIEILWWE